MSLLLDIARTGFPAPCIVLPQLFVEQNSRNGNYVPYAVHLKGRMEKRVPAIFFRTEAGGEPVREWLKRLPKTDRRIVGQDIKTVEFGWPIGMPACRPLGDGLFEVRSDLSQDRIARVLFYIDKKRRMVLLHGFIKKTRTTPDEDLQLARRNKAKHSRGLL